MKKTNRKTTTTIPKAPCLLDMALRQAAHLYERSWKLSSELQDEFIVDPLLLIDEKQDRKYDIGAIQAAIEALDEIGDDAATLLLSQGWGRNAETGGEWRPNTKDHWSYYENGEAHSYIKLVPEKEEE